MQDHVLVFGILLLAIKESGNADTFMYNFNVITPQETFLISAKDMVLNLFCMLSILLITSLCQIKQCT